jgi:hypothetical protein
MAQMDRALGVGELGGEAKDRIGLGVISSAGTRAPARREQSARPVARRRCVSSAEAIARAPRARGARELATARS